MTVAELATRISSCELTDWLAYDEIRLAAMEQQRRGLPVSNPRILAPDTLLAKLDRLWPPIAVER